VLVFHDALGLDSGPSPRFVRRFAALHEEAVRGLSAFAAAVRERTFPAPAESYRLKPEAAQALLRRRASRASRG
jgi:3-methyl-2-oxobutanoate hydroxymethyltransferase